MADRTETILFDPAAVRDDGGSGDWSTRPGFIKRSRHTVATDQDGNVLLFGGITWDGVTTSPTYVQYFEWFDYANSRFVHDTNATTIGAPDTALGHGSVPVFGGKYILVAGGSMQDTTGNNIGKPNKDSGIRFYNYVSGKFQQYGNGIPLSTARDFVAVAGAGNHYLVIGGFTDLDPSTYWNLFPTIAYAGSDVIDLKSASSVTGPSLDVPRGNICALTLNDNRVLVTGGRGGHTVISSQNIVGTYTDNGNADPGTAFAYAKIGTMTDARYFHTCTLLQDGSVLVTGGINESTGTFDTLSSMEIFVPRPAAD
jgi:hypothetical protein